MIRRQHIFTLVPVAVTVATIAVSLIATDTSFSFPSELGGYIFYPEESAAMVVDTPIIDLKYPIKDRDGDHLTDDQVTSEFKKFSKVK